MKKAIILLSGGIDSAVCLAIAKEWGYQPYALSFDYGQRHRRELDAARRIAEDYGCTEHKIITLPELPTVGDYVPGRNTIFLSVAMGWAEIIGATQLFIGINADDVNFPDCSVKFFHAFNSLASVAAKSPISLNAPLLDLTKAEIIKKGQALGVDFSQTITCYNGAYCGRCAACKIRMAGFESAGIVDPNICLS